MVTWLIGVWKNSRSPGRAALTATCGTTNDCSIDWCGSETPACDQAQAVRPEQSNATPGLAAAKRYGTPSWLNAARTALAARGDTDLVAGRGAGARRVCGVVHGARRVGGVV